MIALIDADIILYSVGFAAQNDPINYAKHSVNKMIDSMLDAVGTDEYYCFLTGKNNYREKVATLKKYKGNRTQEKPKHYAALREYLIDKHQATVVDNMEADDAMGIMQSKLGQSSCICSIDKDLDQIKGWHYNWRKNAKYLVSETDADMFFYTQLLMGDSTDNIPGIPGIGIKKAEKILTTIINECHDAGKYNTEEIEEEIYWEILAQYDLAYSKPYHALVENARLVYIRREADEMWEPKF